MAMQIMEESLSRDFIIYCDTVECELTSFSFAPLRFQPPYVYLFMVSLPDSENVEISE